jgi:hypothetical protein
MADEHGAALDQDILAGLLLQFRDFFQDILINRDRVIPLCL